MTTQLRFVLLVLLLVITCSCSTTRLLKKQRLDLLTAEYTYLNGTQKLLTTTPNPELNETTSIFISQKTLNSVLAGADNVSGPIPSISGARFHVDSVRAVFSDGLPILNVKAWAEKPADHLRLDVSVSATIETNIAPTDPSKITFTIHVTKVVPVAKWTIFQFRVCGFVKKLIQAKVAEYGEKLPNLSLPLQSNLVLNLNATSQPVPIVTPDGQVTGAVSIPGFNYDGTLRVDQVLFLSDGIHLLVSVKPAPLSAQKFLQ
jgi:hypothetical protein